MVRDFNKTPEYIVKVLDAYRFGLERVDLQDRERSCLEMLLLNSLGTIESYGYLVPETVQWYRTYQKERGTKK